jgi:catechol 2,3-dioxygenase-like lactoylglutathione lyase family enzyme
MTRAIEAIFEDLRIEAVKPLVRPEPLLRATALAWLRFEVPDLDRQRRFLEDFGMQIAQVGADDLYARGSGPSPWFYHARRAPKPRFVGLGFDVANAADLETAAAFANAGPIVDVDGPGGGKAVRVINPDGVAVEFVYGRALLPDASDTADAPFPEVRANRPVRPPLRPAAVRALGHVVLQCCDFDRTMDWFMRHVGIIASDAQILADGSVNLAFCRLDLGDTPSDHHTLAIAGGVGSVYMHSAYEVANADAVGQGQQVLKAAGWRHGWGIGRHYYGSQIFDYWRDPNGFLVEHYTDGDKYDAHQPTRYSRFTRGSTWMWGQDQPKDFEGPTLSTLTLMLRNLWRGEIKWSRLKLVLASLKAPPRPWLS